MAEKEMKKLLAVIFWIIIPQSVLAMNYGQALVDEAYGVIGSPYVLGYPPNEWSCPGGFFDFSSWEEDKGFDCSGLVSYAANLRRRYTTSELFGTIFSNPLNWDDLQAGDLLYTSGGSDDFPGAHVMIFVSRDGDNITVVHAGSSGVAERTWDITLIRDNWFFSPYRLSYDTIPPVATVTGVENRKTYSNNVTSSFTVTDDIDSYPCGEFYVNNVLTLQDKTGSKTFFQEGTYQLRIHSVDWASNSPPDASLNFTIGNPFSVSDDSGNIITDNGFAATDSISVTGPGNTARMDLEGPSQQEVVFSASDTITAEFDDLWDGAYTVSAYDANNVLLDSMTFTNDQEAPYMYLRDADTGALLSYASTSTVIMADIYDDGPAGLDRIVLDGPNGFTQTITMNGEGYTEETFGSFPTPGEYTLSVYSRSNVPAEQTFWVVVAPQGSHGEEPDYLESSIQTGISSGSIIGYMRSLPDDSHYVANDNDVFKIGAAGGVSWNQHWDYPFFVTGFDTDGDGNVYVPVFNEYWKNKLYKFSSGGTLLATADTDPSSLSHLAERLPNMVAVSHIDGRVYSLKTTDSGGLGADIGYSVLVFNSSLSLIKTLVLPPGMVPAGGVFVDGNGGLWVVGYIYNDFEININKLVAINYNNLLSGYSVFEVETRVWDIEYDGIVMPSVMNPNGGVVINDNHLLWRVDSNGFGAPVTAKTDTPFVVDSDNSIYGRKILSNYTEGVVKISTDNAYAWDPPALNVSAMALSIPQTGRLDVATTFESSSSIVIARYRSYASLPQAGSSDGLVTFTSNIANASVSAPSTETKTAAMIDAGAGYYFDLAAVTPFYEVNTGTAAISQPAQITITYSTTTLATLGLTTDNIGVYQYAFGSDWARVADQTTDTSHNRITAKPSGGGQIFAILGEVEIYGVYSADGVADYYSADPDAEVDLPSADAQAAPLAAASSQGLTPASSLYQIRTVSGALNPVAGLFVNYSTTTLAELGIAAEDLNLYAYNAATGWTELDEQYIDTDYDSVFAVVLQNAEYFGVFAQVTDSIPPSTHLFAAGQEVAAGATGYILTTDTVAITATDDSGVAGISYSLDAAFSTGTAVNYTAPFTLEEGTHTIYYTASDETGNQAAVASAYFVVSAGNSSLDATPPVSVGYLSGTVGANGAYSGPVTITISAVDAESGVDKIYYSLSGNADDFHEYTGPITVTENTASETVYYYAVDKAGNSENAHTIEFSIDTTQSVNIAVSTAVENTWVVDGNIASVSISSGIAYIGGSFSMAGPDVGNGVPISKSSGKPGNAYPKVAGVVYTAVPDGSGGWFIGGFFTRVGGIVKNNIAHILSDGSVDSAWSPNLAAPSEGGVVTLVLNGNTLYVGGFFSNIGGQPRNNIAALDALTGRALDWAPDADNVVWSLSYANGVVYAGGNFSRIGGQPREGLAAVDAVTGKATAWTADTDGSVMSLATDGRTVYAGGNFSNIADQPRSNLAALDVGTGQPTAWAPNPDATVQTIKLGNNRIYVGGAFGNISGQPRNWIAAFDAASGDISEWTPDINIFNHDTRGAEVFSLAVDQQNVYIGGYFDSVGGVSRNDLAAVDAISGNLTGWDPSADNEVITLAMTGNYVYAGGMFESIGGKQRNNLAALDVATGQATDWAPAPNGGITSVAVKNSTVYVSGSFTSIGTEPRSALAAFNTASGQLTDWNPNVSGWVTTSLLSGSTLFVGGQFTAISGRSRQNLAAFNADTGELLDWSPVTAGWVGTLAASNQTIYIGGGFDSVNGQARKNIAAVDRTSGQLLDWNPGADGYVGVIVPNGNTVYVGGSFSNIGGQNRGSLAALDAVTGLATNWNPGIGYNNGNPIVYAIAVASWTVYIGGDFDSIAGQSRNNLAAVDAISGLASSWNPNTAGYYVGGDVDTLGISGAMLYVGGGFNIIGGEGRRGFALFNIGTASDNTPPSTHLFAAGQELAAGATGYILTTDTVAITATDDSGVAGISYSLDAAFSTGTAYSVPFTLQVGTHTVYYTAIDNAGNQAAVKTAFFSVSSASPALLISPSSGPIGVPFTISGAGFGAYSSGITTVLIGGATAPLTLWSTDTIKGTIPGSLSAGEQPVAVMRGTTTIANVPSFTVTTPALYSLVPSSGAIGVPFTVTGASFGNYVAGYTRVLIGGATTSITLWTDAKITGTIPGTLAAGDYSLIVERALNGGVVRTSSATFTLTGMQAYWVAPSSGPIGMPFTITGSGFGNYSSVYTDVLMGSATVPLTLWTDSKIQGAVPGSLAAGQYPVVVERRTADGGLMQTSSMTFEVMRVDVSSITPVSGPIGMPYTIYGSGFGNYAAGKTLVLMGGTTTSVTLWTDTRITGAIPGSLVAGDYPVVVERDINGGEIQSSTLTFTVAAPAVYAMTPSSGSIGVPFTITGVNFGNYAANYTTVLINGATMPLTLWTDTKIQGTVPGNLYSGQYPVVVERKTTDGGIIDTSSFTFMVVGVNVSSMTPVSGPIGLPYTIYGSNFGNYSAGYTRVLIGGATTPVTLWSDTKIQGTIPDIADGAAPVVVERTLNGGQVDSSTLTFTVASPVAYTLAPSSGPVGLPFTITGANFGNYVAGYTRVLIGGATTPVTLWSDTRITGSIPGGLAAGDYPVLVERALNGGVVDTSTFTFTVAAPYLDTVSPSTAAVLAPFTLTGYNFGNYSAGYTNVLINGTTTALTLWTDTRITGKLPFLLSGTYPVLVQRRLNGGLSESATAYIAIAEPVISSMTPTSGAVGATFNLYGASFGSYDASFAKVTMDGLVCALSLWSDTRITGTVPSGVSYGTHTVVAARGQALSNAVAFTIPDPYRTSQLLAGLSPSALPFKLGQVYVYPDPAKGGKIPVFHIETGTADSVKIRIYTVSGQLAHEQVLTGNPQYLGGAYAYEYAWQGYIASGVYYYSVEAEHGASKLKTRGKFAVVR